MPEIASCKSIYILDFFSLKTEFDDNEKCLKNVENMSTKMNKRFVLLITYTTQSLFTVDPININIINHNQCTYM